MAEEKVGVVVKFFVKPGVAAIEAMGGGIKTGDLLRFRGHTTDFTEQVDSMQVDNKPVGEAPAGSMVGIKVKERVRENDEVYKVVD
ncbi:MAG: translation elongation factor-like protein [Desulfobacteraceae bacterium]|nr:MAG: translation elongation factor-like protein [Desulfobacteraceae bacterium]